VLYRFTAVFCGEDEDRIAEIEEANAIVADTQPQLGWLDALQTLHVAFAGGKITGRDM